MLSLASAAKRLDLASSLLATPFHEIEQGVIEGISGCREPSACARTRSSPMFSTDGRRRLHAIALMAAPKDYMCNQGR
jgi:hypothetical protein